MFIHLARPFRMVQTAVTIRTTVCITKTACLSQRRKFFWSILSLGLTNTMTKENILVTRVPHAQALTASVNYT